jgi:hypothetical protein
MIKAPIAWLEWLNRVGIWKRPVFLAIDVPEAPEEDVLRPDLIVREVRGGYPKWAHLKCPRCGEHIQLQLAGQNRWKMKIDWLRRPTIRPSVWQTGSCGAHFLIRRGAIDWCFE